MTVQDLESIFGSWKHGALVFVQQPGTESMMRPAAFVFGTPGGLVWVEPSYAGPYGAATPATHERKGEVLVQGDGFTMTRSDGERITVLPYDPAAGDGDLVDGALKWFADQLQTKRSTWAGERARMRELLLGDPDV